MHTSIRRTPLALAALALIASASAGAQNAPATPTDEADVKALIQQLELLKANYAQEVRRLRELDMQVQAMQARLSGKTAPLAGAPPPPEPLPSSTPAAPPTGDGYASTAAEAQQAKRPRAAASTTSNNRPRPCSPGASPWKTA